jgi:hypothetical protein
MKESTPPVRRVGNAYFADFVAHGKTRPAATGDNQSPPTFLQAYREEQHRRIDDMVIHALFIGGPWAPKVDRQNPSARACTRMVSLEDLRLNQAQFKKSIQRIFVEILDLKPRDIRITMYSPVHAQVELPDGVYSRNRELMEDLQKQVAKRTVYR